MRELSKVERIKLSTIWQKETEFTSWLAENIKGLGSVLGMDLELQAQEASVGDFSLDLLAKDIGSGRMVVIENQLTRTDHDHLGKLLTYAAGFDASVVIWISESIREEHRQTLEWLNERTDIDTYFFGVVVEILQIDGSKPAYDFKPIVFPNEWLKMKQSQSGGNVSAKGEAYRKYFQQFIDELREKHKFTEARLAQPQNWFAFPSGVSGIWISAVFTGSGKARVELYIDHGDYELNKALFDWLENQKAKIEKDCGFSLEYGRMDKKRASRISISRNGSIEDSPEELEEIRKWQVEKLLTFKKVFGPLVKAGLKEKNDYSPFHNLKKPRFQY